MILSPISAVVPDTEQFVVTVEDATITCALDGLTTTAATVTWIDQAGNDITDSSSFTVVQGSVVDGVQNSVLTIKQAFLQTLSSVTPFSCKVESNLYPGSPSVTKTVDVTPLFFSKLLIIII